MRTPIKVSLAFACCVFFATLFAALLHHDTMDGHTLTPLEQLPTALLLATPFSALSLLGSWLGMRRGNILRPTYRFGVAAALLYIVVTFLANEFIRSAPQTITFPSREANIMALKALIIGTSWGIFVPYAITVLAARLRVIATSKGSN